MEQNLRFGQVYLMRFDGEGSEQQGWRPGLVFSNNKGNAHSPNIIALPLTSSLKKIGQPTHVLVSASEAGLRKDSVVLCENPSSLSKERVGRYLTTLPEHVMEDVASASLLATGAIAYVDPRALLALCEKAATLNGEGVKSR